MTPLGSGLPLFVRLTAVVAVAIVALVVLLFVVKIVVFAAIVAAVVVAATTLWRMLQRRRTGAVRVATLR